MQFEEFDNKIKEAARNHHPAYDENAWARMEKLLDKHLPQEDDRKRRIIFFLFLFLLLGGAGAWLFSSKPWKGNKPGLTAKTTIQKPSEEAPAPVSSNNEKTNNIDFNKLNQEATTRNNVPGKGNTITYPSAPDQTLSLPVSDNNKDGQNILIVKTGVHTKKIIADQHLPPFISSPETVEKNSKKEQINMVQVDIATTNSNKTATNIIPDQRANQKDVVADKEITKPTTSTKPVLNDPPGTEKPDKDKESVVQNSPEKKAKEKNKKGNSFFFTLSSGPDVSATGTDHLGKTKLLVGAGMGYTIKDRLTIRSGFYTARKVYTSSPGSYHPPSNFWNYYPNLVKVDADCKVYEIPLSFSYNFGHSTKQNWFVSTGLSSYLMKKETYVYYYKNVATGPTLTRQYTPGYKNNNYFSVLTLSGGYQKNIGKSFSIIAEPYFKMPLSGVGLGKVKLNSGGLLISVGFKPFAGTDKHSSSHR